MELVEQAQKSEVIFIGGKGGVGKTTVAASLACQLAAKENNTLLISTDPAHSLSDIYGQQFSSKPSSVNDYLSVLELDPKAIVDAHYDSVLDTMRSYAQPEHMEALKKHLKLAKQSPGGEEAAMLEAICRILLDYRHKGFDKIVFDTAPTGHTLRLMILPDMMEAWSGALLNNQKKQSILKKALNKINRKIEDEEDKKFAKVNRVLQDRKDLFHHAKHILHNKGKTAIFLVLTPEKLPFLETQRAYNQLKDWQLPFAGLVVNQIIQKQQKDQFWAQRANRQQAVIGEIREFFKRENQFYSYLKDQDVIGVQQLLSFSICDS